MKTRTGRRVGWWSNLALYAGAVLLLAAGCQAGSAAGPAGGGGGSGSDDEPRGLARFEDPDSDFSTTEVRDVNGDTLSFDLDTNELVWHADDSRFSSWVVINNNLLNVLTQFRVRFGTEDGVRAAYFTEVDPPTICDLVVENGQLRIFSTTELVPQE